MSAAVRPHVLAIPGLLSDAYVWHHQIEALGDLADVTVADVTRDDDLAGMAGRALAAVTGPVHVVGHSMGGRVALEAWRQAPERIRSLVLLDTGVHPADDAELPGRREVLALAADRGTTALADVWLPPMVGPSGRADPVLMGGLRAMVERATVASHARQIAALTTRPDATELLATITVPTSVVVGRDDEWSPVAQHEVIAAAIPGARLVVIEDAGHFSPVEQPGVVSELLRDVLISGCR